MSTNKHIPINYDLGSIPVLDENSSLKKCLDLMTKLGKGIAVLVDKNYTVKGVLTDGDLRRLLLTHQNPLPSLLISEGINFGNSQPVVFLENTKPEEIIGVFRNKHISQILIIDTNRRLIGYVNGYDLIKSE
jgi:arabinose-5-phosphate isomerase